MLEFNNVEELQNCKELQNMGRYNYEYVKLNGKEVIACTTNQQYEDIIWGGVQDILEQIDSYYGTDVASSDIASQTRDFILERLNDMCGIEFVDVFNEY